MHPHPVGVSPLGSRRIVPSCLGRCSASPAPTDGGVSCGSAWRGFARHAASDDRDVMPLYPADIFPHPSAVQEQGGGPLIQYWRFSIGGIVISRAAPEMQTDWQLSFTSGSLCLCHPPCCGDPANRHFMHDPTFFLQDMKRNRPCVLWTQGLFCSHRRLTPRRIFWRIPGSGGRIPRCSACRCAASRGCSDCAGTYR